MLDRIFLLGFAGITCALAVMCYYTIRNAWAGVKGLGVMAALTVYFLTVACLIFFPVVLFQVAHAWLSL